MADLPIIQTSGRATSLRSITAAVLRCLLCFSIAAGLRAIADSKVAALRAVAGDQLSSSDRTSLLNAVDDGVEVSVSESGLYSVSGESGELLSLVATTQPAANQVTGYRGISNIALLLDDASVVQKAFLLSSEDTPEHVEAILKDETFFAQFHGWAVGVPASFTQIDSVSGATLTSLAIAESVMVRMGQEKPSLRFPAALTQQDIPLVFSNSDSWKLAPIDSVSAAVLDESGQRQGTLVRTGPLVDSIAGYQGPSELLIGLDPDGVIVAAALRNSYDNQPYVSYLNEEPYFWKTFVDRSLPGLANVDIEAEQVEGVSGATMTSLAVADTLVAAAAELEQRAANASQPVPERSVHWGNNDIGSLAVILLAIVIGTTRLRGMRWVGVIWNLVLIGYFGLLTGNLISLAVLTGWAASGVAWRFAPGLVAVVFVSLVLPPVTKRNLYCSHVCPHGAAQQLLRRLSRRRWKIPARWSTLLTWVPGVTLVAAIVVTALGIDGSVASWEPFNAYIWYVAGAGSIAVAIVSLAVSAKVPMAYCRYACGTGRLLDYVRRSARSDRLQFADIIAVALAVSLWICAFANTL